MPRRACRLIGVGTRVRVSASRTLETSLGALESTLRPRLLHALHHRMPPVSQGRLRCELRPRRSRGVLRVEALGPMRTASTPSTRGGQEARTGGLGTPSRSDRALGSRRSDGTARLPRRTGNPRPRRTLPMRLSRNGMRGTVGPRAGRWPTIDAVGRGSLVGAPSNRIRSQPHQNRWPPCAKLVWPPCAKPE